MLSLPRHGPIARHHGDHYPIYSENLTKLETQQNQDTFTRYIGLRHDDYEYANASKPWLSSNVPYGQLEKAPISDRLLERKATESGGSANGLAVRELRIHAMPPPLAWPRIDADLEQAERERASVLRTRTDCGSLNMIKPSPLEGGEIKSVFKTTQHYMYGSHYDPAKIRLCRDGDLGAGLNVSKILRKSYPPRLGEASFQRKATYNDYM